MANPRVSPPAPSLLRPERADDFAAIRALVAAAFDSDGEAALVEAIRASEQYIAEMSLIAEVGGEVVGHVMISRANLRSDGGDRPIVMLAPLAVEPSHQRAGIGSALVHAVTAVAGDRDEPLVVVEGDPAYYGRFGFEPAYEHGIEITVPDWAPREAGQVLRLAAYGASLTGLVVYPPAFDVFAEWAETPPPLRPKDGNRHVHRHDPIGRIDDFADVEIAGDAADDVGITPLEPELSHAIRSLCLERSICGF